MNSRLARLTDTGNGRDRRLSVTFDRHVTAGNYRLAVRR